MSSDLIEDIKIRAMMAEVEHVTSGEADKPITNTSKMDAAIHLGKALAFSEKTGSVDGFIEQQEAEGQAELVKTAGARLPSAGTVGARNPYREDADTNQKLLESFGIKFGDVVEGDDMWVESTLPEGWQVKATDHSMWSELLDDKGRKRGGIFYKAAFYDRSCHFVIDRRFSFTTEHVDKDDYKGPVLGIVEDCGKEIQRFGPFDSKDTSADGYGNQPQEDRAYNKAEKAAKAWLTEHRPNWEDVAAYWD